MIQDNAAPIADKGKNRKAIRKAVAKLLKGKTAAGNRVFPNATVPVWVKELPVILIFPKTEPVAKYAETPRELERDLEMTVEIYAQGPEIDEDGNEPEGKSLEDILDDIAEQVECQMSRDETFGGAADDSILTNTEYEFQGDGGVPIGTARLSFAIKYFTHYPRTINKQARLADFKKNEIEFHTGDVDPLTREAKDSVDLPQS